MRLNCMLLLPLLLLSLFVFASGVDRETEIGGWKPVNLTDPFVVGIASYAVTEYDRQSGAKLKLLKVLKGEYKDLVPTTLYRPSSTTLYTPLPTTLYRLVLAAKNGSAIEDYQATVEYSFIYKNLISFKRVYV